MAKIIEYSIIVPVYNEKESLNPLYAKLKQVLKTTLKNYEIIFIDDGSDDGSFDILKNFHTRDTHIKVIRFRKNFGKTPALMAGFEMAKGRIIATMDADLQNDPVDLPRFFQKIEDGYDLVNGWRYRRDDPQSKLLPSKGYNLLTRIVTKTNLHDSNCGFKAIRAEALKDINLYGEMHRYIHAILASQGYKITEIKTVHHPRKFGKSKFGYRRIIRGFLDLLYVKFWVDYSTKPIHFFGGLGIIQFILALLVFIEQFIKAYMDRIFTVGPVLLLGILLTITGSMCIIFGFLAEIQIRTYYTAAKIKTFSVKQILS